MAKSRSFAPIIAAFLLLLLVLYVGSYLALVVPDGCVHRSLPIGNRVGMDWLSNYRIQGRFVERCYWPLEQVHRKLKPGVWGGDYWDADPPPR
jgi:hypothetical protein